MTFFQLRPSEDSSIGRILGEGNVGTGLISEKAETMHVELKERVEAATNSYSAAAEFLQYIYQVLAAKNH